MSLASWRFFPTLRSELKGQSFHCECFSAKFSFCRYGLALRFAFSWIGWSCCRSQRLAINYQPSFESYWSPNLWSSLMMRHPTDHRLTDGHAIQTFSCLCLVPQSLPFCPVKRCDTWIRSESHATAPTWTISSGPSQCISWTESIGRFWALPWPVCLRHATACPVDCGSNCTWKSGVRG